VQACSRRSKLETDLIGQRSKVTPNQRSNSKGRRISALLCVGAPFAVVAAVLVGLFALTPSAGQRLKDQASNAIDRHRCELDPSCVAKAKEKELQGLAQAKVGAFMRSLEVPAAVQSSQPIPRREESSESDFSPRSSADEEWVGSNKFEAYARCALDLENGLRKPDSYIEEKRDAVNGTIRIAYRAENGFGGMNRGVRICEFDSSGNIFSRGGGEF
jgi:hypothetical protein